MRPAPCPGPAFPGPQQQHQRAALTGAGGESHQGLLCLVPVSRVGSGLVPQGQGRLRGLWGKRTKLPSSRTPRPTGAAWEACSLGRCCGSGGHTLSGAGSVVFQPRPKAEGKQPGHPPSLGNKPRAGCPAWVALKERRETACAARAAAGTAQLVTVKCPRPRPQDQSLGCVLWAFREARVTHVTGRSVYTQQDPGSRDGTAYTTRISRNEASVTTARGRACRVQRAGLPRGVLGTPPWG